MFKSKVHDNTNDVCIGGIIQSRGFIIFCRNSGNLRYLLIKSVRRGRWSLPKGRMMIGEDDLTTARREVFEEVGIKGMKEYPDFSVQNQEEIEGEKKCVKFFLGEVENEYSKIDTREVIMDKWVSFEEAQEMLFSDDRKESLRQANSYIISNIL